MTNLDHTHKRAIVFPVSHTVLLPDVETMIHLKSLDDISMEFIWENDEITRSPCH